MNCGTSLNLSLKIELQYFCDTFVIIMQDDIMWFPRNKTNNSKQNKSMSMRFQSFHFQDIFIDSIIAFHSVTFHGP